MKRRCAVVIGIERYRDRDMELVGPVDDAIRVADWLLDHGQVDPGDLRLLLKPSKKRRVPKRHRGYADPTLDNVVKTVKGIGTLSQDGRTERLVFYFSGHGVQDVREWKDPYLVCSDYEDPKVSGTSKLLFLRAVEDYLASAWIPEQIFISDACRDFVTGSTDIGHTRPFGTNLDDLPAGDPEPYQIRLAATSPGGTARLVADRGRPGRRVSAFTDGILQGLLEPGPAMRYDHLGKDYVVRADWLFKWARGEAFSRVQNDPDRDGTAPPAVPAIVTRGGTDPPILARFASSEVSPVRLTVLLSPDAVSQAAARVAVWQPGPREVEVGRRPAVVAGTNVVAEFALPPYDYEVRAEAERYRQKPPRRVVDLYGPLDVLVEMDPVGDEGEGLLGPPEGTEPPRTGSWSSLQPLDDERSVIVLGGPDATALQELRDQAGAVVATGSGRLEAEVAPGLYRARQVMPFEPSVVQPDWPLVAQPGERQFGFVPTLAPPSSRLLSVLAGPMRDHEARPHRRDALSLLAALGVDIATGQGGALDELGLFSFEAYAGPLATGIVVLAGYDDGEENLRRAERFRALLIDPTASTAETFFTQDATTPRLVQAAVTVTEARSHLVHMEQQGAPALAVFVPVITGHLSVVVIHRNELGQTTLLCQLLDGGSRVWEASRRQEVIQRYLVNGDAAAAHSLVAGGGEGSASVGEQFYGAIASLRVRDWPRLLRTADELLGIPALDRDATVFAACAVEPSDPILARQLYAEACAAGLPGTIEAVRVLVSAAQRLQVPYPVLDGSRNVWSDRVSGTVWTAAWEDLAIAAEGIRRARPRQLGPEHEYAPAYTAAKRAAAKA